METRRTVHRGPRKGSGTGGSHDWEALHMRSTDALAIIGIAGLLLSGVPAVADEEAHGISAMETFEVVQTGPRAYSARGSFIVATTADVVWQAIADYEAIPRVAPSVKVSRVISRDGGRVVVEQEAVAAALLFSKRVHLLLEIEETPPVAIRFRDVARREFTAYEGFWTLEDTVDGLRVSYGVDVQRGFSAPDFLARPFFRKQAESLMRAMRDDILRRAGASGS
jgi:ribosome-associated toxin RatA of RatAB toxin-antitoxin module